MRASQTRRRDPLALACLLLLGTACAAPPEQTRDLRLLERFRPESAGAEIGIASVETAGSTRRSLVSTPETPWRLDGVEVGGRDLTLSLAGTAPGPPARAIVESVDEGETVELFRVPTPTDGWTSHRVELPSGTTSLRLRSEGETPVAWAELTADAADVPSTGPPDLVLVLIDTLRSDHLSSYGYRRETTPALDRLAAEAIRFETSFSTSTWTLPSTATLLTGLMPQQHGVRQAQHRLDPELPTVAGRLAEAGYRTVAIADGGFVAPKWGFAAGFDRFDSTGGEAHYAKDVAPIVASARRFLATNRHHPFFLVIHTYETHKPYVDPEGFAGEYLDPDYRGRFRKDARFPTRNPGEFDGDDLQRVVDFYDGEIRRADQYLGTWLEDLRATERWESTGILVTSDHGEEFRERGDFGHGFGKVFDPNVRVPLILKPPGSVEGRVESDPVTGLDVAPTLLRLAGLDSTLPGRSLLEAGPAERARVVRGLNSFTDLHEDRLRLDHGRWTIVRDRVRDLAHWFDRDTDPGLAAPRDDPFAGPAAPAAIQLTALQAWLDRGALLVRLPDEWTRIRIPEDSRIAPVALWNGFDRRTTPGNGPFFLVPGVPDVLVFSPRAGRGWTVEVLAPERETVTFGSSRAGAWDPFVEPPPEAVVLPAAKVFEPSTHELTPGETAELEALGYL